MVEARIAFQNSSSWHFSSYSFRVRCLPCRIQRERLVRSIAKANHRLSLSQGFRSNQVSAFVIVVEV
jgi:hypothetical protein